MEARPDAAHEALSTLKRLTDVSARLLQSGDVTALLEALLDEAIDLTRGDRGFLVLVETGQRRQPDPAAPTGPGTFAGGAAAPP